ncbi:MAG: rhodanese-like domain-containing protein [Gammaproteobacteria bacterium]|nr:rhodanese-like domain-containing protein [Gammaproteobacteria bacterium]
MASILRYDQAGKRPFLVCRSGNRSLRAADLLRQLGYHQACSLQGGLHEWEGPLMRRANSESQPAAAADTIVSTATS